MRNFLLAIIAITLLHISYTIFVANRPNAVSELELPVPAPDWTANFTDNECRVVVVIQPECPFCNKAGATATSESSILEHVLWVARDESDKVEFETMHPALNVVSIPEAIPQLKVWGVPAAFLIQNDTIIDFWVMQGDEDLVLVDGVCHRNT